MEFRFTLDKRSFWIGFAAATLISAYVCYSTWRIYWIYQLGWTHFRWHAVLWLYLTATLALFSLLTICYSFSGKYKKRILPFFSGIAFLWMLFCALEVLLRILNISEDYSEQRGGYYINPHNFFYRNIYALSPPNSKKILQSGYEYNFLRKTNSLGFSDKEWTKAKDKNVFRIITLGDSFTEGDGAPFDSTYPKLLEKKLNSIGLSKRIEVLNAGQCGSDPFFGYKMLQDVLLKYNPDVVLFTNSHNDAFSDYEYRGGLERFQVPGKLTFRHHIEPWMYFYSFSRIVRTIYFLRKNDGVLLSNEARKINQVNRAPDHIELYKKFSLLATKHNFRVVQVLRPEKTEFENMHYEEDMIPFFFQDTPTFRTIDLLTYYSDSLHVPSSEYYKYYWIRDGHHNSKGYNLMANSISDYLLKSNILPLK